MPFPGILAGSELEKKVDRCVVTVMGTGRDKAAAIAICRSAIAGASGKAEAAEEYKDKTEAIEQANYRSAGPASTQICATCQFGANEARQCSLFNFTYEDEFICDEWLPDIVASRERLQVLQVENKARLAQRKAYVLAAEVKVALKRGLPEQRAMFAKLGVSSGGGGGGKFIMPDTFDNPVMQKDWIAEAQARISLKREISGETRSDLEEADFVFPELRSFPIQKPADVRAAVNAWGRATAVRARGFTFEDFRRRLTRLARRKGPPFVAMLPLLWRVEQKGVTGEPSVAYAHGTGGLLSPLGLRGREKGTTRLGRFLHQRRLEEGLSLPQLAEKMPIGASTIGQIERGEIGTPSEPVLMAFARALMIPKSRLDDLLRANAVPRQTIARNAATAGKQAEPLTNIAPQRGKNFSVFKDAQGKYRWLMVSSSAYKDRDDEIVSTGALANAVKQLDDLGKRGPLLWWHLPIRLGDADFGMMYKRMLIESGNFVTEQVGAAVDRKAEILGGSIGFKHPKSEPDMNGIFNEISQFERSLLPRDKASNFFTSLITMKEQEMSAQKIKELVELVGAAEAAELLTNVRATDKAAQEQGFTYKSQQDLEVLTADQGLEYFILMKEYETAEAARVVEAAKATEAAKAAHGQDDEVDTKANFDRIMAILAEQGEAIQAMGEMIAGRQKQGDDGAEVEAEIEVSGDDGGGDDEMAKLLKRIMGLLEKHDKAIEVLTAAVKVDRQSSEKSTGGLQARLMALESEQPPAVGNGYRASQKGAVVEDDKKEQPLDGQAEIRRKATDAAPHTEPFVAAANQLSQGIPNGNSFWGQAPPPAAPADAATSSASG